MVCVNDLEALLARPSINNVNFLKYSESVIRLLSMMLDSIKGKLQFGNELIIKAFVYSIKYLFFGTIFQDKIMKSLTVHNDSKSASTNFLEEDSKEESKYENSSISDASSNTGSTYTDSAGQDVLMKAKTSACNVLKCLFKFGGKILFNYRYCIVPPFVLQPSKDFQKFADYLSFEQESDEFFKAVDDQIYKDP